MPGFLVGVVCRAQGGPEKGCAHRAKARLLACTFVRFMRSAFTHLPRGRMLRSWSGTIEEAEDSHPGSEHRGFTGIPTLTLGLGAPG